ncbi:MAG: CotH kinase family protein, partial [Bacteroidia bacterium]
MRYLFLLVAILFSVVVRGQAAGDSLFGVGGVHTVYIDFVQTNWWDTLTAHKTLGDQTGQDIYMSARVTLDGRAMDSVGVRLKGNASYAGHPGTKKPLKLKFNEYINGQKYDGLKSLHLNNSAYDPTMLREKLMLDVLRRHGLPAPRCTYAAVYFNQAYVGLYKMI